MRDALDDNKLKPNLDLISSLVLLPRRILPFNPPVFCSHFNRVINIE